MDVYQLASSKLLSYGLAGSQDVAEGSPTTRLENNLSEVELPGPKSLRLSVQIKQGFRVQHAVALTTVLHRCLLQGEYLRAGRTWGILLRMKIAEGSLDLRDHDNWGLGAEILYQQHSQLNSNMARQKGEPLVDGNDFNEDSSLKPFYWYSPGAFKEAQEYFERLILQYPYQKHGTSRINALDFYPAMFGLWIYSVQQQHGLKLQYRGEPDPKINEESSKVSQNAKKTSAQGLEMNEDPQSAEARTVYVGRAREIQDRLDALLLSPPFSDNARLCNLQNMVNQWVSHISHSNFKSLDLASAKEEDETGSSRSHWMDS